MLFSHPKQIFARVYNAPQSCFICTLQYIIRITTEKSRIPICSGMANSFRFEPVPIPVPVPVPDWFRSG